MAAEKIQNETEKQKFIAEEVQGQEGKMSVFQKLLLSSVLLANESSVNFEQIYTVPILQTLGTPLRLVFVTMLVSGTFSLVLLPSMGWISDRGSNPNRRKAGIVVLSSTFLVAGGTCLIAANGLQLNTAHLVQNSICEEDLYRVNCDQEHRNDTLDMLANIFLKTALSKSNITKSDSVLLNNTRSITPSKMFLSQYPYRNTSVSNDADASGNNSGIDVPALSDDPGVPFKAGMGMLGFILLQIGFDCMVFSAKSWMLTCSPRGEHTSVLGLGLVMASAGGITSAALANVRVLGFHSGQEFLKGASIPRQAILQGSLVIVLVVVCALLTLVIGWRRLNDSSNNLSVDKDVFNQNVTNKNQKVTGCTGLQSSWKRTATKEYNSLESGLNHSIIKVKEKSYQSNHETVQNKLDNIVDKDKSMNITEQTKSSVFSQESKAGAERDSAEVCCVQGRRHSFKMNVGLLCASSFFSAAVLLLFSMNISDYLGKVVYGGHPAASPLDNSDGASNYQAGLHFAGTGFIIYYVVYLVFSSIHSRVLEYLGYKVEFVLVQLLMSSSMMVQIFTGRAEVFIWLSVVAGVHRACFHVVPFAVINDIVHSQAKEDANGQTARVGLAMSLVTSMSSLTYVTIFPLVGPLEVATGILSLPLWVGVGSGILAALIFLLVRP